VIEIWGGADALRHHHPVGGLGRSFWLLVGMIHPVRLAGAGGRGPGRVPAGAELRICARRRALGVSDRVIMFRHMLPNAMVATLTMLPFIVTGAIGALASLDFLGFGLPSSAPSLGELTQQAQAEPAGALAGLRGLLHLCHHAGAADLHLRRRARCLRPAKDLSHEPEVLKVGTCRPSGRTGGDRGGEGRVLHGGQGRDRRAGGRKRLGQVGDGAVDGGLLSDNADRGPGSVTYLGQEMLAARGAIAPQVRGNDISFIFQEPMTIAEPAAHDRAADRRKPGAASGADR
jgi:hypothetical protein